MTTLSLLDFEAGTEGSNVTVSSPWSKSGSTTVTYAAAAASHGAFGARFSSTGTSGRFQYDYGSAQTGVLVLSFYITPRAFSSAVQYLALATTLTSGGTNRGDVRINTGGTTRTVSIRNVTTAVATSTTALAVGTTYRLEWRLDHAASTQTLRIYVGDSTTVTETLTGAWSGPDSRVLAFGPYSAAASGQIDYDSVQVADDWTGPYSPGGGLPAPDATKIGHVGDSLTAQSPGPGPTDMDARYLAAGYADADVNGISGRFVYNAGDTSGGTPAVIDAWAAASFNPYDIVVALGTNDTLSALSSNWLTGLNNLRSKIASTLPGAHRIWWVNVVAAPDNPGGMDGLIGTKSNTVADYNAFLVAQLNGTTEKILDFNAYAKANLTDLAYWNTSDGIHVHMTNAGYTARNAWIAGRFAAASGSASGTLSWSGTTSGSTQRAGASGGTLSWAGTATGTTTHRGAATGALSWTGTAAGTSPRRGSAAGSLSWVGTASGVTLRRGAATGTLAWTGTASGAAPTVGARSGSASGSLSWTGAAAGSTTRRGAAAGTLSWTGTASGTAPSVGARSGSAYGTHAWTGAVTGKRTTYGTVAGQLAWTGTTAGRTSRAGSASGTLAWIGAATGHAPAADGDGTALPRGVLTTTLPVTALVSTIPATRLETTV